jgi:hypothetical protein
MVTYEHFMNLERVPTASVLLRVDFAAIDGDGHFVSIKDPEPKNRAAAYDPAPRYEDQTYATTYFLTAPQELEMFNLRANQGGD